MRLARWHFWLSAISINIKLVTGDPAAEIGSVAQRIRADLVVVGHQRRSPFARWWSGPGGAYLIDHIYCSMLVSQNIVSDTEFAAEMVADAQLAPQPPPQPAPPTANSAPVPDDPPRPPNSRRRRRCAYCC